MSAGSFDPKQMTTLERESLIEGWYRDLVDPGHLGIDLDVWLWGLHHPGLAWRLSLWPECRDAGDPSALFCDGSALDKAIGRMHWMSAFEERAIVTVARANLPSTAPELPESLPELGDLGAVWLALARRDDELASGNDAQLSLVTSARALALLRWPDLQREQLPELALGEVARIADVATDRNRPRLRRIALA